jgi:hypothetical protein
MPSLIKFFFSLKNFWKFKAQDYYNNNSIIIYSEGSHDWPHLGPIIKKITEISNINIGYLSSEIGDPGLVYKNDKYKSFFIGMGFIRTLTFQLLRCKVILLTLPDLDNFHLKKNKHLKIKYVYTFHSINSTHAVYRDNAFNAYIYMLCVGPHHKKELKKDNELKQIKGRVLLEHGSIKLDTLINDFGKFKGPTKNQNKQILLAPSWGNGSFIENRNLAIKIIEILLNNDYRCVLRLHPMTMRKFPKIGLELKRVINKKNLSHKFTIEEDHNNNFSLSKSDLMISDWSGTSTEFAFAFERPVLFIDTKQKINNKRWVDYGLPCIEDTIREIIGMKISVDNISNMNSYIDKIFNKQTEIRRQIVKAKEDNIYNIGKSDLVGAQHLVNIVKNS